MLKLRREEKTRIVMMTKIIMMRMHSHNLMTPTTHLWSLWIPHITIPSKEDWYLYLVLLLTRMEYLVIPISMTISSLNLT